MVYLVQAQGSPYDHEPYSTGCTDNNVYAIAEDGDVFSHCRATHARVHLHAHVGP